MLNKVLIFGLLVLLIGAFATWRIIERLTPPETPKTLVTIPEGLRVTQINEVLRDAGVLTEAEIPLELEGRIFPDTYEFFLDSSLGVVLGRFEENLNARLLGLDIDPQGEDTGEILIVASLLEKEVIDPKERRIASGVLYKRLEEGVPLQVDATLCYIKNAPECLPITKADKEVDSPYNTYLYRGLPPGPISSPGSSSIAAAARPAQSPYWYYLSDPETGKTIFATTLDEHNDNIVKYLSE